MNTSEEYLITLKINTKILQLTLQYGEEELYEKLLNDDSYTIQYVKLLIQNELYTITDGGKENLLREIYRLQGDREILIYNVNINESQNHRYKQCTDKENEFDSNSALSEESNSQKSADLWTDSATVFILDKYKVYLSQIGPMKKFKTKKTMWAEISKELQKDLNISKTPLQVENRYKTVLKRKKKAVENNRKSGSSREEVPFEEELREISQADDSIEPEVLRSAKSVQYPKKPLVEIISSDTDSNITDVRENVKDSPPKKKYKLSNEEKKKKLFEQKEEAKERRHQEKLQLLKDLFSKKDNSKKESENSKKESENSNKESENSKKESN